MQKDDVIYRQAAIDELKGYIAVNSNPNHDARIWEEGMNCAITVIGALPSVQPHWIPCSERLPNEDEEVLVTSNYGILIALWRKTWDNKICWFETIESKSLHKVTAWMPLPKPYGGESE